MWRSCGALASRRELLVADASRMAGRRAAAPAPAIRAVVDERARLVSEVLLRGRNGVSATAPPPASAPRSRGVVGERARLAPTVLRRGIRSTVSAAAPSPARRGVVDEGPSLGAAAVLPRRRSTVSATAPPSPAPAPAPTIGGDVVDATSLLAAPTTATCSATAAGEAGVGLWSLTRLVAAVPHRPWRGWGIGRWLRCGWWCWGIGRR
ncbi:hypothetical protein E2562_019548 [Oryza meyeriana var. granulata]|uniref:Uncharacterized protein n=1 Tax=Oryza meyeriana var. granulata TaxID=110450 RepID=A0A6G1CH12_9ORYZ|nr:hypothetical protein E2562_019548 [Oryza meyeriana var. granulata]